MWCDSKALIILLVKKSSWLPIGRDFQTDKLMGGNWVLGKTYKKVWLSLHLDLTIHQSDWTEFTVRPDRSSHITFTGPKWRQSPAGVCARGDLHLWRSSVNINLTLRKTYHLLGVHWSWECDLKELGGGLLPKQVEVSLKTDQSLIRCFSLVLTNFLEPRLLNGSSGAWSKAKMSI